MVGDDARANPLLKTRRPEVQRSQARRQSEPIEGIRPDQPSPPTVLGADAIEATLPHRRFRDPEARLFPESGADALPPAIAKACRAAAVPLFSPHDLRHRRISLLHLRGVPWAHIGEFVGQRNLAVTANT
jgi:integrase